MTNVLVDLKADRRATLAMMEAAYQTRQAAAHPDPRQDDLLRRAREGDWTWMQMQGREVVEAEPVTLPEPKAARVASVPDPATDAQIRYIRVLLSKLAKLTDTALPALTDEQARKMSKKAASALIDQLAANVERLERQRPAGLTLPKTLQQRDAAPPPAVSEGRYAVRGSDGTVDFYKVDHGSGRWAGYVFASLLIGAPGGWSEQRLSKPATATLLARIQQVGVEESARLFGEKTETCGNCSSPLSDPQSRVAGYGETCAGKHGYWYPDRKLALQILGEEEAT